MPRLLGAGTLLLVAWLVATVVKKLIIGAMSAARVDERLLVPLAPPVLDVAAGLVAAGCGLSFHAVSLGKEARKGGAQWGGLVPSLSARRHSSIETSHASDRR